MDKQSEKTGLARTNAVFGAALIVLGIVFLVGELFDIAVGQYIWPFFVIVPGIMLFLGALMLDEEVGQAVAMVSGIVTMVGLILLVQSITDAWASWAYTWALVAPTGVGIGLWLFGSVKERADLQKSGRDLVKVGLGIFVVAAIFFELVIGINGFGVGAYALPLLLIGLGFVLLLRNFRANWHKA
ncbi:MAG TPA: hypothetical protein PLD25_12630 [Chloroflexota bacterium]|nr:hypothetical protein [Chloroflexota bacterium]HUM71844.1 hypothetical protein [Chloroflexota bacterium]